MHPAFSVIFFTVASGAGFGFMAVYGLGLALGLVTSLAIWPLLVAGALAAAGLLSSMLHLGHPERAWRAFSQWRSSWLSREGVLSVATFAPLALLLVFAWLGLEGFLPPVVGLLLAALAVATVYATGMIYASLKPVPQWHDSWVVPVYLGNAVASGALLWTLATQALGQPAAVIALLAAVLCLLALLMKLAYWRSIARPAGTTTAETATGLGGIGKVRMLDPPHTSENYLLKEMGYRVARKHARVLRRIAVGLGYVVPLLLVLLSAFLAPLPALFAAALAVAANLTGLLVERWLFFAEARHLVVLYYGRDLAA